MGSLVQLLVPCTMNYFVHLTALLSVLQFGNAQRFFTTKFSDCGSLLNIEDATTGSVKMTAPFDRRNGRHVLGKGKQVEICIEGVLNPESNVPVPFRGLKNQAHGQIELGVVTVPLPVEFCGVQFNGCNGITPQCNAVKYGEKIKLCSSLTVPKESPDVDVEVTWKVLVDNNYQDTCDVEYDVNKLRSQGKLPLVCIKIPSRVQEPRTRG